MEKSGIKERSRENIQDCWVLIQDPPGKRMEQVLGLATNDINNVKNEDRLSFLTNFERYVFRKVFRKGDCSGQIVIGKDQVLSDLLGDTNLERVKNLQAYIKDFLQRLDTILQNGVNGRANGVVTERLEIDCKLSVCESDAGQVISVFSTPLGNERQHLIFELLSLFSDVPVSFIHKCEFCGKLFYKEKTTKYCSKNCMTKMNTNAYRARHPEKLKESQYRQYEKRIGEGAAKSLRKRRQQKGKSPFKNNSRLPKLG